MKAKQSNFVSVFVREFPFSVENESIYPKEREREIESCKNSAVKQEKFFVWKLLEKALLSLGLKIEELDLRKDENGKWVCSACHISLTHSGNFVGVAISDEPVGLDIEKSDEGRFSKPFARKILTAREQELFSHLPERQKAVFLNALWTKKEAAFKLSGGKAFLPKTEGSACLSQTKTFKRGCDGYFITVASENAKVAVFHASDVEFSDFEMI